MTDKRKPERDSYLADDTQAREDKRRKIEIAGLIAATGGIASEQRRDRDLRRDDPASGEALEGSPKHPILGDKQHLDGLAPDVATVPDLTTREGQEAYQLQQQLQMQKRHELQNRPDSAPKPAGPG